MDTSISLRVLHKRVEYLVDHLLAQSEAVVHLLLHFFLKLQFGRYQLVLRKRDAPPQVDVANYLLD